MLGYHHGRDSPSGQGLADGVKVGAVGIGGGASGNDAWARTLNPGRSGPAREGTIPGPPPPTIEKVIPSEACQAIEDWIPPRAAG